MATKRRGRPVASPDGGKTENFSTRITRDLRERLDQAAAKKGISLSKEVGLRLQRSFETDRLEQHIVESLGGEKTFGLLLAIRAAIEGLEAWTQEKWHSNAYTADELKKAIALIIEHLAPKDEPVPPDNMLIPPKAPFNPHVDVALGVLLMIRQAPSREESHVGYGPLFKRAAIIQKYLGDLTQRLGDVK